MTILLIRHGETDGNASRIIQHPETPLNARGRAQATKVAIKISEERNVEAVISSDYRRAQETALEISDRIKIPPTFSDSLRERNFGDLRGKSYDQIGDADLFAEDFVPPGGESWAKFRERVDSAWDNITERKKDLRGTLVIVTHGLFIRSLIERTIHIRKELTYDELIVQNTSVTCVTGTPPWEVAVLANTDHLDQKTGEGGIV